MTFCVGRRMRLADAVKGTPLRRMTRSALPGDMGATGMSKPRCPSRHTAKCDPSQRTSGVTPQFRKSGRPARFTICNSCLVKRDEEAV